MGTTAKGVQGFAATTTQIGGKMETPVATPGKTYIGYKQGIAYVYPHGLGEEDIEDKPYRP